ncbi:tyrosine-protein phosphatase [Actinomadura barringtoniae]|uniref:Tyrosine-protein phosphatase n=1 Tax=Actinomadura barringtoniae TaxID=1427535 RepID=A0A939PAD9_9ACTN|nr:tyrosine-protein phosphatase [Actinomadura barringtoniae]MBO2448991.1 tyrosine-protein phosphatase [Actinomadura barringtoniae]
MRVAIAMTSALVLLAPVTPAVATSAQAATGSVFTAATVTQAADGSYTVGWQAPDAGTVAVTATTDASGGGAGTAVGSGGATGSLTVPALPAAPRWYFRLVPAHGTPLVVADRSLHLAHARNFRDVGGYRTADGHWVRMGAFYRSNKLSELDQNELNSLTADNVKLVVDLRNGSERSDDPDKIPAGATYQVADLIDITKGLPTGPDLTLALLLALPFLLKSSKDAEQNLGYRLMVNAPSARIAYRDLMNALASQPASAVFHCTAGKDRTGWGAAVLLTILGVDRTTVYNDFLASNTYYGGDSVRANWLDAAFAEVNRSYGSFDAYVHKGLGLSDATIAALKSRLLAS